VFLESKNIPHAYKKSKRRRAQSEARNLGFKTSDKLLFKKKGALNEKP
jgi:hypothetical protein